MPIIIKKMFSIPSALSVYWTQNIYYLWLRIHGDICYIYICMYEYKYTMLADSTLARYIINIKTKRVLL